MMNISVALFCVKELALKIACEPHNKKLKQCTDT